MLAIPGMAADLHPSSGALAWVMAGYVLAGGSLMIAGGSHRLPAKPA
ncbi:hypothetical protein QRX50_03675 [Amycolatopsis carbonis]|uniref:Uncharacterized protein n=1 Tax=Amycolatopsis carbonis TaxID=715471 RepID=A0A9Y2IH04_9PSEU|nr:hypothetical protein [Amycolatopsis sp. 2-15]WIX79912.1 hypothetical protein QRX50_03675 [Amycolatopsis sp. 2-15]